MGGGCGTIEDTPDASHLCPCWPAQARFLKGRCLLCLPRPDAPAVLCRAVPAAPQVFTEFIAQCGRGLTPNPDLACNRHIKFDALLSFADQLGADMGACVGAWVSMCCLLAGDTGSWSVGVVEGASVMCECSTCRCHLGRSFTCRPCRLPACPVLPSRPCCSGHRALRPPGASGWLRRRPGAAAAAAWCRPSERPDLLSGHCPARGAAAGAVPCGPPAGAASPPASGACLPACLPACLLPACQQGCATWSCSGWCSP